MNRFIILTVINNYSTPVELPLMVWGVNVEKRFEQVIDNTGDVKELRMDSKATKRTIQQNHNEVMGGLHNIQLQLKDKKDRE